LAKLLYTFVPQAFFIINFLLMSHSHPFESTLNYPHKEFLIPLPHHTRFNPRPPRTRMLNYAGTRNPRGLTRPAQDS